MLKNENHHGGHLKVLLNKFIIVNCTVHLLYLKNQFQWQIVIVFLVSGRNELGRRARAHIVRRLRLYLYARFEDCTDSLLRVDAHRNFLDVYYLNRHFVGDDGGENGVGDGRSDCIEGRANTAYGSPGKVHDRLEVDGVQHSQQDATHFGPVDVDVQTAQHQVALQRRLDIGPQEFGAVIQEVVSGDS